VAAVPSGEQECFKSITTGARGIIPITSITSDESSGIGNDKQYFFRSANNEATPIQSCFLDFTGLPSVLIFGALHGPQFKVSF